MTPAKAFRPLPPTVSTSTVMPVVASLTVVPTVSDASLTFWLLLLTARSPYTETNP